jgi:long-chain fatty acid transport protein
MLFNNKKNILSTAISAVVIVTGASTVNAAGFQLKEQSAEGQGNSFAGQTAKAIDASTIFFNPAGMSLIEGNHVQSNVSYITSDAKYNNDTNSPGASGLTNSSGINGGESAFVPAAYALWDYSDNVKFGISINAPFGLSTKYDDDWVGAEYNVFSEIKTINIAPSVSYRINDKLSIGGNIQIEKVEGKLTNQQTIGLNTTSLTTLEADDTSLGFGFGVLYEYSDRGRIGFNYRSEINHDLKGDVSNSTAGVQFDATADLTLPAVASIGLYHEINDKWTVLADLAWTDWSVFDELDVKDSSGTTRSLTEFNWDDSIFFAVGSNYQYNEKLQLKFGVAYDEGAANDTYRTAGIPDASRYWASVGASYQATKQTTINAGFSHIRSQRVDITETARGTKRASFSGNFKSSANILSVGVDYKF